MIRYTKFISLILHIEEYTNKGIDQDKAINRISRIRGVSYAKPAFINQNIEIMLKHEYHDRIPEVVISAEYVLDVMLKETKEKM